MPPELIVFFTAVTPFADLKLAIPLGLALGLSKLTAFFFAIAGSIFFASIALLLFAPLTKYFRNASKPIDIFAEKLFEKTRNRHSKNFERFGALSIILFVAIPIPASGVISGSFLAFLFGVDYWKSLSLVSIGACIAGSLVLAGFQSIEAIINLF